MNVCELPATSLISAPCGVTEADFADIKKVDVAPKVVMPLSSAFFMSSEGICIFFSDSMSVRHFSQIRRHP